MTTYIQSGRFHAVSDVILEATLVFTLPPFYLPMLIDSNLFCFVPSWSILEHDEGGGAQTTSQQLMILRSRLSLLDCCNTIKAMRRGALFFGVL